MSETGGSDPRAAHLRLRAFRRGDTGERLFRHPTPHPAGPTGFCYCEGSLLRAIAFHAKAALLAVFLRSPWNAAKLWMLRRLGARIGKGVYLSAGVWIDPMFPELVTIEDGVFIGLGARILTHEFRIDEFRAGRAIIRRGAFIGGGAAIACGVEIGEGAVVGAFALVARDVPAGASAVAPAARILHVRGEG